MAGKVKDVVTFIASFFPVLILFYASQAQGSHTMNKLAEFSSHWLESGCELQYWCHGYDLNLSGQIDFRDFSLFADKWRTKYETDSDGDGLSDFQEIHKYLTDPNKWDTDGDSISDGDWNERREYSYSVRSILQFLPPFERIALVTISRMREFWKKETIISNLRWFIILSPPSVNQ